MVELRKRPAPAAPAAAPPPKRASVSKPKKEASKPKPTEAVNNKKKSNQQKGNKNETATTTTVATKDSEASAPVPKSPSQTASAAPQSKPSATITQGQTLKLDDDDDKKHTILTIPLETHDSQAVTLSSLLSSSSDGGVVIFTYPKASTPGCTTQAQLFRDAHDELARTPYPGLSIYGLSADGPKSNATFRTKQKLQYPLLSDVEGKMIRALGMGNPVASGKKSAKRGVVVIGKDGMVRLVKQAGPAATVEAVKELVSEGREEKK